MTLDLDNLARLEAAATPGPWEHRPGIDPPGDIIAPHLGEFGPGPFITRIGAWGRSADAALIVAARTALPAVVAEVRRLEAEAAAMAATLAASDAEVERLRGLVARACDFGWGLDLCAAADERFKRIRRAAGGESITIDHDGPDRVAALLALEREKVERLTAEVARLRGLTINVAGIYNEWANGGSQGGHVAVRALLAIGDELGDPFERTEGGLT